MARALSAQWRSSRDGRPFSDIETPLENATPRIEQAGGPHPGSDAETLQHLPALRDGGIEPLLAGLRLVIRSA